jgi:hypothetical protein
MLLLLFMVTMAGYSCRLKAGLGLRYASWKVEILFYIFFWRCKGFIKNTGNSSRWHPSPGARVHEKRLRRESKKKRPSTKYKIASFFSIIIIIIIINIINIIWHYG